MDVQVELLGQWWEQQEEDTGAIEPALAILQERREALLQQTIAHARKMRRAKFDVKLRAALGAEATT